MSKINIQRLSRLISSSKIVDESMNIQSLSGRVRNYRLNSLSLKLIQQYYPDHTQKNLKDVAVSLYHQLREAHQAGDLVTVAGCFSPFLFRQWRINPSQFMFYNTLMNIDILRVRVNKQELEHGVWGQILVKYVHQVDGKGVVEKHHLLERKLIVEDNLENWRIKKFQN